MPDQSATTDLPDLRLLIAGQWVESDGDPIAVVNPSDGSQLTTVPDATADEVDRAVRAARSALATWRHTNPFERCAMQSDHLKLLLHRDLVKQVYEQSLVSL